MSIYATLNADITAAMLGMDAPEGEEGYPADHVIGPAGSTVRVIDFDDGDHWVEVIDFANDPYAAGFVLRADLTLPGGEGIVSV